METTFNKLLGVPYGNMPYMEAYFKASKTSIKLILALVMCPLCFI